MANDANSADSNDTLDHTLKRGNLYELNGEQFGIIRIEIPSNGGAVIKIRDLDTNKIKQWSKEQAIETIAEAEKIGERTRTPPSQPS